MPSVGKLMKFRQKCMVGTREMGREMGREKKAEIWREFVEKRREREQKGIGRESKGGNGLGLSGVQLSAGKMLMGRFV
mgnify:CR=1 FL=1